MKVNWQNNRNSSPFIFKHRAKWDGIMILHHYVLPGEVPENSYNSHELNITLAGKLEVEKKSSIGKSIKQISEPGNICITPSGQPFKASWTEKIENLAIALQPALIQKIALENNFSNSFDFLESFKENDFLVQQIGLTLINEINSAGKINKLYIDSLKQSLVIHILKNYTNAKFAVKNEKGGLAGYRLKRVEEFINDNLENDITLAEIAEIADLSQYHFSREFRKSTGTTPQRYLMKKRIERAKELLTDRDLPIVEVSLQTGFKNQSHFSTIFRKFTNLTPKNWRELKRN